MLTTARGLLMLSPLLMPSPPLMLRPIPGWLIATAMPDTEDTTATLMPTMARGLLMLSQPLMPTPRLTLGTPTDMPTMGTMATPTLMDTGARSKPRENVL